MLKAIWTIGDEEMPSLLVKSQQRSPAVASLVGYRINPPLDAPATGEAILKAINAVRAAA